eukprot:snap_masked-scaffold_6-processed-gene-17.15-mRNA-1 protein AED:1.00 eAED:1.00 QI:0/-1/0/0/-1/1/1/0/220
MYIENSSTATYTLLALLFNIRLIPVHTLSSYEYEPECSKGTADGAFLEEKSCCAELPYKIRTQVGVIEIDLTCLPMNSTFGYPHMRPYNPFPLNFNRSAELIPPSDGRNQDYWCPLVDEYNSRDPDVREQWGYCKPCHFCAEAIPTSFPTYTMSPEADPEMFEVEDELNVVFWLGAIIVICPFLFLVYLMSRGSKVMKMTNAKFEESGQPQFEGKNIVLS